MYSVLRNFIYVLVILSFTNVFAQFNGLEVDNKKYVPNELIIKLKDSVQKERALESIKADLNFAGINKVKNVFNIDKVRSNDDQKLKNIYSVTYNSPHDLKYVIGKIKGHPDIEYAEPHNIYTISLVPDEEFYENQYSLPNINAEEAWDVTTGSSDIIIAIIDTGVDFDHPDIEANMWAGKGYDFTLTPKEDPYKPEDPMEEGDYHGTHVAGIASAVTNNGIGVASIGYKAKIMALKVTSGNERDFAFPFEAFQYAVDNGAHIINCSWTGYSHSRIEQDIMNYVRDNGIIVVAAAGNENNEKIGYPASYDNVISVAATKQDNKKWSASSYGPYVDVAAPGAAIYSTTFNDSYGLNSGTSMSAPLVAGLASLVKTVFPDYNPNQIAEQIRATTDYVDDLFDDKHHLKMGSGKINAYKAVSTSDAISSRAVAFEFFDKSNGNGIIQEEETVEVKVDFLNYLSSVNNLNIKLRCLNKHVTITDSIFVAGNKTTLEEFNNDGQYFSFDLAKIDTNNYKIDFLLVYEGENYSDFQWFRIKVNPTYDLQTNGTISVTFANTGAIGFDDHSAAPLLGQGITFKNSDNILFEGAFMYGLRDTLYNPIVMDIARTNYLQRRNDDVFGNEVPFSVNLDGEIADQEGYVKFKDTVSTKSLGVTTYLNTYTYNNAPDDNYIILRYSLQNSTKDTTVLKKLYAGLFFDWDIPGNGNPWLYDVVNYDSTENFAYIYNDDGTGGTDLYVGLALLTEQDKNFYAISSDGSNGSVNVQDIFNEDEKFTSLSNGLELVTAGPDDIACVISGGPFDIDSLETVEVAFLLAIDESLDDLKSTIIRGKNKYNNMPIVSVDEGDEISTISEFKLDQNFPNPFNPSTVIRYQIKDNSNVELKIFDVLGREVVTLINEYQKKGYYNIEFNASNLASGMYIYQIRSGGFVESKKMMLMK